MNENRYFYMEHKSTTLGLTDEKGWFLALAPTTASRLGPGYKGLRVVWYEGKRKPDKAKHDSIHSSHMSFFPWHEVKPFEVPAEVVARFRERYPNAPSGTAQPRGFEGWESPKQHISVDRNEAHDWLWTHGFSPDPGSSRYYNSAGDIGRITEHGNMAEERAGRGWVVTVQPKGGGSDTETRVYPGKPKPRWEGGKRRHGHTTSVAAAEKALRKALKS